MRFLNYFLLISLLVVFSCGEKVKPDSAIGKVSITGIELLESSNPGGRIQATFEWKHIFSNQLQLTFTETGSGESFPISINPNSFSSPYLLELPYGTYTYSGSSASEIISSTLPLAAAGQFSVSKSAESVVLKAYADYGLFTFSKANLSAAPKILEPLVGVFAATPDFYYSYIKRNELLKTELALASGKSFRIGTLAQSFSHQQFQIKGAPAETLDVFQPVDFEITSNLINLGENGYPETLFPYHLTELPNSQKESSGLQWIQGRLFSINDGGNSAEIYELNPQNGSLLRTIKVSNATNVDWEDLAASSTHLFVGDFGNNLGTRTNLRILKIPVTSILNQTEVSAELIEFSYPDQSDFSGTNSNHNFDCEALLFWEGQLHLFSKNLGDGRSKHYTLSPNAGKHLATLQGSFDAKGLITGADVSADGKNIVLLGYENKGISSKSFLWTFGQVSGSVFSGQGNQFFLGSPAVLGQTEGISIDAQLEIKISGEQISLSGLTVPPKLFEVDLGGVFTP